MCFNTYDTPIAATNALRDNGLDILDFEMRDVIGGLQPVLICHSIRDAEEVQNRGFNSRLVADFASD
ncbi:MAG: hypothetical protein DI537_51035 [Stutzerimonas stutzeri]|nr:MAG: hypothetical protein DI537_51035 [Stutzerimonas stutzeri]